MDEDPSSSRLQASRPGALAVASAAGTSPPVMVRVLLRPVAGAA